MPKAPNKDNLSELPPPPPSKPPQEPSQPPLPPQPPLPILLPKFFPININLHTNLPDEKDENGLATKIFPLTGDMMGVSPNKPFFSSEIDYSYGASFITSLEYEDQIKVFFNRATFRKFITECHVKKLNELRSGGEAAREAYEKEKKDALEENGIAERNVIFMLNSLIRLTFPKKTQVKETYSNHATNVLSVFKNPYATLKRFYNPFIYYTYLKYEGKEYTVVKALWQNDFYSHPEFYKLYNLYRLYTEWFNKEKKEEIIIKFKSSPFYFTGKQLYSSDIVEYIVMAFAQDFMAYEDAVDYLKTIMTFDGKTLKYDEYKAEKEKIDKELEGKTMEERGIILNKIVAIKDFELVSSHARYSERVNKDQIADFENYKKLIKKVYDFIKDQPDWENFNELKKETLSKVKENIYNKKLRCLLSDITYLSKKEEPTPPPPPQKEEKGDEEKKDEEKGDEEKKDEEKGDEEKENTPKPVDECIGLMQNVRRDIERRSFYVGVQKKGGVNGEFEISVYVDLFGGKIDQKNKGKYRCAFLGEKLGNEFEALWNGRYYVKSRFYFDGSDFDEDDVATKPQNRKEKRDENNKKSEEESDDESRRSRRRKRKDSEEDDDDSEYEGGRAKKRRPRPNKKTLRRRGGRAKKRHNRRTYKKSRGGCGAVCLPLLML